MNRGITPITLTAKVRSEADLRALDEGEGGLVEDVRELVVVALSEEVPFRRMAFR